MSKSLNFLKSHFVKIICCLFTLNNLNRIYYLISHSNFNQDEYQHTHIAWNSYQGLTLYKDFFEHHGPFYAFLNSFILSSLENAASFDTLILFRTISFISFCFLLVMIFIITKKIFKDNNDFAFIAVTTLTFWPAVVNTCFEIRPDTLQNLVMLIGFFFLISYLDSSSKKNLIIAGLFFGIMLMFNFKTIIIIIALAIAAIIQSIQEKKQKFFLDFLVLLLSALVIFVMTSLYFHFNEALDQFIHSSITENFPRFINRKVHFQTFFRGFKTNFLTDGILLSIFSILSFFILPLKSYKHKLLMTLALIPTIGTIKGLHFHYNLIYLSYFVIISSKFFYKAFFELKPSRGFLLIRVMTLVYLASMIVFNGKKTLGNILHIYIKPMNRIPYLKTEEVIDLALSQLDRDQIVLNASDNSCPGFIFNKDHSFQWCWNAPDTVITPKEKVHAIAISAKELKKAKNSELSFSGRDYKVFNSRYGPLCLIIKKEYVKDQ